MEKNSRLITIDFIHDAAQFIQLREAWNAVLEKSGIHNPFLRHEWLSAWWKGYGADNELFVVCFRRGEDFIGFVPLMQYTTKLMGCSMDIIGFISNHWTRMDFILTEEREVCLKMLLDALEKSRKIIVFAQLDAGSANFIKLGEDLKKRNVRFAKTRKLNAFFPLEGTWEEYLKNQSRNFRQDFNKKLRRLEKNGPVSLVSAEASDNQVLEKVKLVAQKSWQSGDNVSVAMTEEGQRFYCEVMASWPQSDALDFTFLKVGDQPIAYMIGIKEKNCYFAFETAYNSEFQQYSPGVILHNLLFARLFKEGIKRFDFGYIAEYKKRWTEEILETKDITIFPEGIWGTILFSANRMKEFRNERKLKAEVA